MKHTQIFKAIALSTVLAIGSVHAADDKAAPVKPEPYALGKTLTKSVQASITPAQAIEILQAGNVRFASGQSYQYDLKKQIKQTGLGQYPLASVVACIDSRSAPEQVFNTGVGEVFAARVAGNTVNEDILGSLEFASKVAGARAIVVLGHTSCGAIKGACDGVKLGNLTGLLEKFMPAVKATKTDGERNSKNHAFVHDVTETNVAQTIEKIRMMSPVLKEMEDKGEIKIVGAMLDVSTGKVEWLK
ncbi:carbonic anhydrase family protein [Chitinibacter sp. GC72]|uniref:carbonic anhydrase family protein n=1 Tax=Chitinibacter sp. GC72 TaxID=1526917 RepID=UPI0012F9A5A8|nr:carbonic anhydrase family protein [Chitinibacter sp. GC72]